MKALAAAVTLMLAAPLSPQEPPAWRAADGATGQIEDVAGLEALVRDFPDSGSVRLRLLSARLAAGDQHGAMEVLRWLGARSYSFGPAAREQIPALVGDAFADEARALLAPQPAIIAASEIVAKVPAEAGLVEGMLVPAGEEFILATSVSSKALHLRGPEGVWQAVPIPGANDLSGIVSAPGANIVWVASANIDGSAADPERFTGLIGVTGDPVSLLRIPAPAGVAVSDLAIGPDGTVYASDPIGGGVYRAYPGAEALTALVAPGTFRSPQGLAVSADGRRLYVSDYRYGLAMIDLQSGTIARLASDVPVALDGVDGLWLHGQELIAMQNGTSPMRIVALHLSADGARITGHRVLEQANPEWTEPLGGNIAGGSLYYVGTGQWERYEKGTLREGMSAIPTIIRQLPLVP